MTLNNNTYGDEAIRRRMIDARKERNEEEKKKKKREGEETRDRRMYCGQAVPGGTKVLSM